MNLRKIYCVTCLVFVFISGAAQNIDSLKALLVTSQGVGRCNVLFWLSYENANVDNALSVWYAEEGYRYAKVIGDTLMIVKGGRMKGQALRRMNMLKESKRSFKEALVIARRHVSSEDILREYKTILNGIAITYTYFGEYDKALDYGFQCFAIWEKERNKSEMSISLNNIGLVYYKLKDYPQAINYYSKAVIYKRESNDYFDMDRLLINIGLCHNGSSNFALARENFEAALRTCQGQCSEQIELEAALGLAISQFGSKDLDKALVQFKRCYVLAKQQNHIRFQLDIIYYLASIYLLRKDVDTSLNYLVEAEGLINNGVDYPLETMRIFNKLFEAYATTKDFQKVAFYQSRYIQMRDSLHNEELTNNLISITATYHEKGNREKIASQKRMLRLNEEVIERQRLLNTGLIWAAITFLVLTTVLVRNYRQKKIISRLLVLEVKERTGELAQHRNELIRTLQEKDIAMATAARLIRSTLMTMKGICLVGLKDTNDPRAQRYIRELETASEGLSRVLVLLYAKQ